MVSGRSPPSVAACRHTATALAPQALIVSAPTMPATSALMQPTVGPGLLSPTVASTTVKSAAKVTASTAPAALSSRELSLRSGVVCRS